MFSEASEAMLSGAAGVVTLSVAASLAVVPSFDAVASEVVFSVTAEAVLSGAGVASAFSAVALPLADSSLVAVASEVCGSSGESAGKAGRSTFSASGFQGKMKSRFQSASSSVPVGALELGSLFALAESTTAAPALTAPNNVRASAVPLKRPAKDREHGLKKRLIL